VLREGDCFNLGQRRPVLPSPDEIKAKLNTES
jgi:hypothetical protein